MAGTGSADQLITSTTEAIRWLMAWSFQSFLLLSVAWIGLRLDRSRSAATRHRIWLIAVLAATALPLFNALSQSLRSPIVLESSPAKSVEVIDLAAGLMEVARPASSWTSILWPAIFVVWATGATISLLRLAGALWKLSLIRRDAQIVSPEGLGYSSSVLLKSARRVVPIALSKSIQSPGLAGLLRPVILLPADIMAWTSREERISIIHHEIAHIQRRDHYVNLFQSALTAFFFFHPMLRYACRQLSLERELACDDRVLSLGTEPKAYAEAILKAVERNFSPEVIYLMASFNSRRTLERRIEMIINTNRMRRPLRQWPFLLLPVMLIAVSVWLITPAASSQPASRFGDAPSASSEPPSPQSVFSTANQTQTPAVINRQTISVDSVSKRPMVRQVRGMGMLVASDNGRLKAVIEIPSSQARDIKVGQPAFIDTRNGEITGKVIGISLGNPATVDIALAGSLPQGAIAGLNVDSAIEIERLNDVLSIRRPANGRAGGVSSLFKLDESGSSATRVQVRFGKSSVETIEILEGLKAGDQVIISDMSKYEGVTTIGLK
jgi:beta-lactamase regulating signal transducer with metallopeptidase domain